MDIDESNPKSKANKFQGKRASISTRANGGSNGFIQNGYQWTVQEPSA